MNDDEFTKFIIQEYVKPGDVCFDIGANIGDITETLSQCVGESGLVLSFEPIPTNYKMLTSNTKSMRNVKTYPYAVTERTSKERMWLSKTNPGDHRTWNDVNEPRDSVIVDSISLDSILLPDGFYDRVSLMKIDVQGAEIRVLAGAAKLIKSSPRIAVVIEYWPMGLHGSGFSGSALLQYLRSLGLTCFIMYSGSMMLRKLSDRDRINCNTSDFVLNLWCVKQ